uniref:DUF1725 domain-containing protein n=1 Tax=Sus scrofa TaxID=9823 RepID=A0A5G2QN60_PIG
MHLHVHCSIIHNSQDMETTKCPLADDWIKKMWYIHTMEYYSAIKKNKIMPFTATWMERETLILSEVSQKDKDKCHMIITYIWKLIYGTKKPFTEKKLREQTCSCQGEVGGSGMDWEFGVDRWKLAFGMDKNEILLCSTGNYV